ncbi:Hypothetical predicted protein [Octopus vulgaris]|uniref:VWFA domain-containing protein n=1 Tax=Octopus vulgaris TaxID=6645 RepID=A0AA36FL46_OCTVU|nr:Hypothetical predicted protein [Octopus vulgaris]
MTIGYLLLVGICLGIARHVYAMDLTLKPGETSNVVIDATIRKIRTKCILAQDNYFLRRLAEAQMESIQARTGGIWRVTEAQLTTVKDACKGILRTNCINVQTELNVAVSTVTVSDLQKPLYSGLVMSLFILNLQAPIAVDKQGQADYWVQHINPDGAREVFVDSAKKLEQRNDCASAQIDLVFVIDSSGSVGEQDFNKTKIFLENIVRNLDIGPDKTRVAVIRFSTNPHVSFSLSDHSTNSAVRKAIDDITYNEGFTHTDEALDLARTSVFTNTRKSVAAKVLVLVTDGKSESETRTVAAAQKLKDDGVTIFTIGVVNPSASELTAAASEPSCTHFINLKDYNEIDFIVREIESDSCEAPAVVQNETSLLNMAIPKTNETKQQVLQINNMAKSTLGTTVLVTKAQLTTVKDACKGILRTNCSNVQTELNVAVSTVTVSDLQKPLYSGLVMSLFILNLQAPIAVDKQGQADYWVQHINPDGAREVFVDSAKKLEQRNDCASAQIDLVFLIDSSGSVQDLNFRKTKDFLKNIVRNLDIGPDKTRVAVIRFSTNPHVSFSLSAHTTNSAVRKAIDDITYTGGHTYTDEALDLARTSVFTNTRKSVAAKVLVLVTDGHSESETKTVAAAQKLKDDGVTIFTIGVVRPRVSELTASASEPSCTHFINLKVYNEIGFIVREIESDSCKAPAVVQNETSLLNMAIPKTNETKQQVLQINNMAKSTLATTVLVSVQCGVVTVYGSFNNSYPNEADYDYETSATDYHPGKLFLLPKSELDQLFLTVLSKKRFDLNSSACDNPSYDISFKPTSSEMYASTASDIGVTKQLLINAWIYAGLLLLWQMA